MVANMQEMTIFLGSSAHLMSIRRKIGRMVNHNSGRWLRSGIDVRLLIWEDYTSAYNGSSKQDEYIEDLVLPSTYAVFIADNKIGPFTRKELEAKKAQDHKAILCYLLPIGKGKRMYKESLYDDLTKEGLTVGKVKGADDVCEKLKHLIDTYVAQNGNTMGYGLGMNTQMLYTTLSDDKAHDLPRIETAIRSLDDFSKDFLGIHCELHPTGKQELLFNETDHYFPIFTSNASDENVKELDGAIKIQAIKTSRLKFITLFDAGGGLYKNKLEIHQLLEGKDFFPTPYRTENDVFVELLRWLQREKQRLFANVSVEVKDGQIALNGKKVLSVAGADPSGMLDAAVANKAKIDEKIEKDVAASPLAPNVMGLVAQRTTHQSYIQGFVDRRLNTWVDEPICRSGWQEDEEKQIANIDTIVTELMRGDVTEESAKEVVELLRNKEEIVRKLVEKGYNYPHRLLSVQMYAIGVFDTYIKKVEQPKEEDELYGRLLEDAERYLLAEPAVEMIRMNYANSFARAETKNQAQQLYEEAIRNLEKMRDGSVMVNRSITIVYVHLIHLLLEAGELNEANIVVNRLRAHVEREDAENIAYLVDRCMLAAAEVAAISVKDTTQYGKVEAAQMVYKQAKEQLKLTADNHEYGDVFVYLPNAIARYYIDHFKYQDQKGAWDYIHIALGYLDDCIENCVNLYKQNYSEGLFHMGEFYHQRGFLYASIPQAVRNGLSDYHQALELRIRYYELSKDLSSEWRIAQTLVNFGALELEMNSFVKLADSEKIKLLRNALSRAEKAVEIYGKHRQEGNLASEQHCYEALQLQGTVEYAISQQTGAVLYYNYAIEHLMSCWRWNEAHPSNEYSDTFENHAGRILRKHNFI